MFKYASSRYLFYHQSSTKVANKPRNMLVYAENSNSQVQTHFDALQKVVEHCRGILESQDDIQEIAVIHEQDFDPPSYALFARSEDRDYVAKTFSSDITAEDLLCTVRSLLKNIPCPEEELIYDDDEEYYYIR